MHSVLALESRLGGAPNLPLTSDVTPQTSRYSMSKRAGSSRINPPSKRAKKALTPPNTTPDDEDHLSSRHSAPPDAMGLSTRAVPSRTDCVPALTTLCARVFVTNFRDIFLHNELETLAWLKHLPETIALPLFSMLRKSYPCLLSNPLISTVQFVFRGDQVVLSGTLPGITTSTLQAISTRMGGQLRDLRLIDLDKCTDDVFSKLLNNVNTLEILVLRGCTKVNRKTLEAASLSHKTLKNINLNYTSSPRDSIISLARQCLELEVLKLAGVPKISDGTLSSIFHWHMYNTGPRPLAKLRNLKLKHTRIGEYGLRLVFDCCPHLSRLDVSSTLICQATFLSSMKTAPNLWKLSVTSTPLMSTFFNVLVASPKSKSILFALRTLHIGALGSSPYSEGVTGSLTLTDYTLDFLTDYLVQCRYLENISLVGNSKLGLMSSKNSALERFCRKVGRRCKVLNLARIPRLKSSDLAGLLPVHERELDTDDPDSSSERDPLSEEPSPLQTLILNNTGVDDKASRYIASCVFLQTLELAGTKMSYNPLFQILDACPRLRSLDITGCRGVKVHDRKRFFEIWENERKKD